MRNIKKYLLLSTILLLSVLLQSCLLSMSSYVKDSAGTIPLENEYDPIPMATKVSFPGGYDFLYDQIVTRLNNCDNNKKRFPSITFVRESKAPEVVGGNINIVFKTFKFSSRDEDRTYEKRSEEKRRYEESVRRAKENGEELPEEPDYTTKYIVTIITLTYNGTVDILTNKGEQLDGFSFSDTVIDEYTSSYRSESSGSSYPILTEIFTSIGEVFSNAAQEAIIKQVTRFSIFKKIGDDIIERLNKYYVHYVKSRVYMLRTKKAKDKIAMKQGMDSLENREKIINYLTDRAGESDGELQTIYYFNLSLLHLYEKNPELSHFYYQKALENKPSQKLLKKYERAKEKAVEKMKKKGVDIENQ